MCRPCRVTVPVSVLSVNVKLEGTAVRITVADPSILIGYRLNMAKYARPRSLSGTADRTCEVCFRSKTEGGHIFAIFSL